MLRYIYLLCFIYFELVLCNNYNHGKDQRRLRRRHEYVKSHRTSSSPYENFDMLNFVQKPEAEAFDPYSYEKTQRSSIDDLPLHVPALRMRRSRQDLRADELSDARAHRRLRHRHLAHHPKRKCSYAMFPFFSHKNKTKMKPPGSKDQKRKSHPFCFSKFKESGHNPSMAPMAPMAPDKHKLNKQYHITEKNEVATMKELSPSKLKNSAKFIQNSRLYFANNRITNGDSGNWLLS